MQKKEVKIPLNKVEDEPTNSCHFGKIEFWENHYLTNVNPFDWYQDYDGLKDIITQYIVKSNQILNLGCGTSSMTEEMYKEGYKNIINADWSENAIQIMKNRYSEGYDETFEFVGVNATNMYNFKDKQFDIVIDKGCLDSVLCGEYSMQNSKKMLSEISRVLNDHGIYIMITYGDDGTVYDKNKNEVETPGPRKPICCKPEFGWKLKNTYRVYKPNIRDGEEDTIDINNSENYHYIYVFKKGEHLISPGSLVQNQVYPH